MCIGHWQINLTESIEKEDWFGFVYKITRIDSGRMYIGKKQFNSYTRKKVANRKNRKRVIKESDWRKYTGSCQELNDEIKALSEDHFKFEIIKLCKTKGELTFSEIEFQIKNDVLSAKLTDGTRAYYNGNIMNRWFS